MTRMKHCSLLLTLALLICGGSWPFRAAAASMAPSLPPLFSLPECARDDLDAEWTLPVIDLDGDTLIIGHDTWLGTDDLSARLQIGWCEEGLLVRACVRDDEIVADLPEEQLWKRDALEIMVAPAAAETSFDFGPTFQLVCAAPAPDGTVRHHVYCQRQPERDSCRLAGRRVQGGYELRALLHRSLFGKECALREGDAIRLHVHLDDYDSRDAGGALPQPRVMTVNAVNDLGAQGQWYAFCLEGPFAPEADDDHDLTPYCHPLPIPRMVTDGSLKAASPMPVRYEWFDDDTGELLADFSAAQEAVIPCPDRFKLRLVARLLRPDGLAGHLQYTVYNATALCRQIAPPILDAAAPDRQVQALGLLSCLEWLKERDSAVLRLKGIQQEHVRREEEMAWRLRRLEGRNADEAPGLLRFLNLLGDSDGAATIAFSRRDTSAHARRGVPERATLTVSWGTLPVIYAELRAFPSDAAASAYIAEQCTFMNHVEARELPGLDELRLTRGHLLIDGLPWDFDPEHLVTVTCSRNPHAVLRLTPEDALTLAPEGFTCLPDALPTMVERLAAAGLRQLSEAEAAETDGHVIRLGSGPYAAALPPGVTYYHSRYGVPTERLYGRQGNLVFETAAYLPENALDLCSVLRENRPITRAEVACWKDRLLDHLGGDCPEAREDGRRLHSGEVHSHTSYSDGTGTPGGLMAEAALCGMDFLTITDHGTTTGAERLVAAQARAGNRFPVLVGEELTLNKAYHLNFFPLQRVVSQEQTYRELLADAHGQGAVVMLNHPMTYGTNLRKFWYGDFRGTGLEAVERRIEYLDRWREEGTAPVILGSTDTHSGIFGNYDRSVVLTDELTGRAVAEAIRNRNAGMLAPDLAQYVVADPPVVAAVRAALADPELPSLHARRLADAFAGTDFAMLLRLAPDGAGACMQMADGDPDEVIFPLDD